MSSPKQCVVCEDQGENAKIRNHYGCESSCDACRKFFESSVKEMTKSSHKFLGGKNADRHCYNNFGCEVKGKRSCTSCRLLKCIEYQMNPELPLRNAAREVQRNDPEGRSQPLDYYTAELRATYESNLNILLSAAYEARGNLKMEPAMISGPTNNCEESAGTVNSEVTYPCHYLHSEVLPQAYDNVPMDPSNHTFLQKSNYPHYGYMPNVVSNDPMHYSVENSSYMHTYSVNSVPLHYDDNTNLHMGHYDNAGPDGYTHGKLGPVAQSLAPLGSQLTDTLNQEAEFYGFERSTPVPVVQNHAYYAPAQWVNHAGPSSQIHTGANDILYVSQKVENLHLDPTIPKDCEIKDTAREKRSKRKNPTKNVNETGKRSISADPFNRLAIKHNTQELCKILNTFGMKMDTGYECNYANNPPDKRCECGRSIGLPDTDPATLKKILRNPMMDGPHHFANWMCFHGLHPDIFALENPMKVLSRKSICAAGRFYQSRDLKEYFEAESEKKDGKYMELEKNKLCSVDNYFICCKRADQFYWQIYYGTDELCVAGYGPYPGYDERKYFFNKEFHQ